MPRKSRALLYLIVSLAVPASSLCIAQTQRADRVYLRELEGIWIKAQYLEALDKSRMPHQTAKKVPPLVIGIQRQGRSYPIVTTNFFDRASVQAVLEVEPGKEPGLYRLVIGADDRPVSSTEVQYLWFRGQRNAQGGFDRLKMAEPVFSKGRWADYVLLKQLAPRVNRAVLAGKYTDEKGVAWEFSDSGQAYWPDRTFAYEISLNDPAANCEYFEAEDLKAPDGKLRYGYAWQGGKLLLYPARLAKKSVRCEPRPFATLAPQ